MAQSTGEILSHPLKITQGPHVGRDIVSPESVSGWHALPYIYYV